MPQRSRRRRRLYPLAALLLLAAFLILRALGGSGGSSSGSSSGDPAPPEELVSSVSGVSLPAPISGETAVAVPGGTLVIGGLDASETSLSGIFLLDRSGKLRPAGSLSGPLHDAAATGLGGKVLVLGGGTATSTDTVQALPESASPQAQATASVVGHLPAVRSDLSAVTIGPKAYVLGGYDGTTPDPAVLATADGRSFSQVAELKVPARYLATVAVGGRIFAFGGETASGGATDAIQEVDPAQGTARVIGHLPRAVSHAAAVVLGGEVYVLGGEANGNATNSAWRFDPASGKVAKAPPLPIAVAGGAAVSNGKAAYLLGGTGAGGETLDSVVALRLQAAKPPPSPKPSPQAGSSHAPPFEGQLMIADRGNNRIIVVNNQKKVLWRFPSKAHPAPPGGFYFPDDAFFIHGGTGIISNEEQNERIVQLSYPAGKLLWSYGHPGQTGSEPGYLHEPDDAYLAKNGNVSVADAQNCRVLIVSPQKKVLREFGDPAECTHEPPRRLASPNGDTPLANGDILVSEVNGSYIDEITRTGKLVWSLQLPIAYPSDPQQLGPDLYLVADYSNPGGIYEFTRQGKIVWSYHPESGNARLNHPSLAERLPSGDIAVNDDYRQRVVIIDPHTKKIVWQYGVTGHAGRGPNHLHIPDGFDLLGPEGEMPTHPFTG
ncbi:MAG TPA: kelch repeat-containing protein [Solirubrobacterales bacterium]|nr:kelch repeat-containing protein [Solirubrobacterales bacterium]